MVSHQITTHSKTNNSSIWFKFRLHKIRNLNGYKNFCQSYPSVLNNQQKTKIKKHFIELVKVLEEHNLIESKYKIIYNGTFHDTQELTIRNIHEGFVIYEKLSV